MDIELCDECKEDITTGAAIDVGQCGKCKESQCGCRLLWPWVGVPLCAECDDEESLDEALRVRNPINEEDEV